MSWNVLDGDQFFLWNVKTGLFLGQPEVRWAATLSRQAHLIPTVTSPDQYQIFTLRKEHPEQEKTVTTKSTFHLYANDLQMSTNLYGASEILDAPPQPVTLETGVKDQVNIHTRWMFRPADEEQQSRNDNILHFGMPIYLLKLNARRYLRLSLAKTLAAVDRVPILNNEMDPWMMIPASAVHVCISPKDQQCHSLSGVGVTHAMMRCRYGPDNQIECRDDEGHPMFAEPGACEAKCQVPSYQCTGPPLYQCELKPTPPHQAWQSFDQCVQKCGTPSSLPQLAPPIPDRLVVTPVVTHISHRAWWWAAVVVLVALVVIGLVLYRLVKNPL